MTILNDTSNESDNLIQQLEGLRFVFITNREVLNENPVLIEFLAFKMDMVESFIEELQSWEGLGNDSKCNDAIENAQFFMDQIQVLLDRMLDAECEKAWVNFQRELKFNSYSSKAYEYVLSNNFKVCSNSIAG